VFEELEDRMPYMTHPVTMILFYFMACTGRGLAKPQQNAEFYRDA
jgi:hypothetical protein